jgi:protein TonB
MSTGLPPPPPAPAAGPPPFAPPPPGRAVPAARKPSALLPLLVVGALAFFAIVAAVAVAGIVIYMNGGLFRQPTEETGTPVAAVPEAPADPQPVEPAPVDPAPAAVEPPVAETPVSEPPASRTPAAALDRETRRSEEAPAEAPPPAPPPAPVRVGDTIAAPTKIRDVRPVYPAIAQQARVQGVVILEATISAQGRIENARVLRSIPLLDQAALDAVRQWEYEPTYLNGVAVPVIVTITVNFTLSRD